MILGGKESGVCPEPSEPPTLWSLCLWFIAPTKCRKRWDANRKFGLQVRFQTSDGPIIRALVPWNMASMAPHPAGPFLQRFNALLKANSGPKFHDQLPNSVSLQRPTRPSPTSRSVNVTMAMGAMAMGWGPTIPPQTAGISSGWWLTYPSEKYC
jgi:hypothetical protein